MSLSSRQCHHPYIDNNTTILESTKMSPFSHQHPCIDDNVTILACDDATVLALVRTSPSSVITLPYLHQLHQHCRWCYRPCIDNDVTVLASMVTTSLSSHQWCHHACIDDVTILAATTMSPSLRWQWHHCFLPWVCALVNDDVTVFATTMTSPYLCQWPSLLVSMMTSWYSFFSFLGGGPDRGRSPLEWGDFPSMHPFVHSSIRPSHPRGGTDGWTDVQMDKTSPHSTGLCPLS